MSGQALSSIKVLDLGCFIAGSYCGKLLADFGADVIKVEEPIGGSPTRKMGPFPHDEPNPEKSGLFAFLNTNKKSITLNLKDKGGVVIFNELVKHTDIVIEDFSPKVMPSLGLAYEELEKINPGIIMVSISPFGQTGPYKDYSATDLVAQAVGGFVISRGDPAREPIRALGRIGYSEFTSGWFGANGALLALAYRDITGEGQQVDVSRAETMSYMVPSHANTHAFPEWPEGNYRWPVKRVIIYPSIERCKDGFIGANFLTVAQWQSFCQVVGIPDEITNDPILARSIEARAERKEEIDAYLKPWLMSRTKKEITDIMQEWRIPSAMVADIKNILESPQLKSRNFFVETEHPELGAVVMPSAPFKMSETPWQLKKHSPRLGQDNKTIYSELLGYNREQLTQLKQQGII